MTSHHPADVREGWCANCHGVTSEPPPPGFRWARFRRASGKVFGRLVEEGFLEPGATYEFMGDGGSFTWNGEEFR
jgi:hypothetical protein